MPKEGKMPPQRWGNDGDNIAGQILGAEALPSTSFPAVATEVEEGRGFYNDIEDCFQKAMKKGAFENWTNTVPD